MVEPDKDRTGPPRGSGRYSDDGHWWWDDSRQQWFPTVPDMDVLEIDMEDVAAHRWSPAC